MVLERLADAERGMGALLAGGDIDADHLRQDRRLHADAKPYIRLELEGRLHVLGQQLRLERRRVRPRWGRRGWPGRGCGDRTYVRRVAGICEQRDAELLVAGHGDAQLDLAQQFAIAVVQEPGAAQLLLGQTEEIVVRQVSAAARKAVVEVDAERRVPPYRQEAGVVEVALAEGEVRAEGARRDLFREARGPAEAWILHVVTIVAEQSQRHAVQIGAARLDRTAGGRDADLVRRKQARLHVEELLRESTGVDRLVQPRDREADAQSRPVCHRVTEAQLQAGFARGEVGELTCTRVAVGGAGPAADRARHRSRERADHRVSARGRQQEERVVARRLVHRSRLIAHQVVEHAEGDRIRLELVDVRHAHAEVDLAEVLTTLQRYRGAVAGAGEVVLREREAAAETLPVRATAAVADVDAGVARALLDHGPHERQVAALVAERFRRQVDRFEELGVIDRFIVAAQARIRDQIARVQTQQTADDVILGDAVAGDLDRAYLCFAHGDVDDARVVRIGAAVDDGGQAGIFIQVGDRVEVVVEGLTREDRTRFGLHARDNRGGRYHLVPADGHSRDRDALFDGDGHGAVGVDLDVFYVPGADVAELVVVRIDLLHVVAQRIGVEHLADGGVHQRAQHIVGHLLVAVEDELADCRVFDDDVRHRDAARRGPDVGLDVGEIPEPENRLLVGADLLHVERRADLGADDCGDLIGRHVRIAADVDGSDNRLIGGGRGGQTGCHHQRCERDRGDGEPYEIGQR